MATFLKQSPLQANYFHIQYRYEIAYASKPSVLHHNNTFSRDQHTKMVRSNEIQVDLNWNMICFLCNSYKSCQQSSIPVFLVGEKEGKYKAFAHDHKHLKWTFKWVQPQRICNLYRQTTKVVTTSHALNGFRRANIRLLIRTANSSDLFQAVEA